MAILEIVFLLKVSIVTQVCTYILTYTVTSCVAIHYRMFVLYLTICYTYTAPTPILMISNINIDGDGFEITVSWQV